MKSHINVTLSHFPTFCSMWTLKSKITKYLRIVVENITKIYFFLLFWHKMRRRQLKQSKPKHRWNSTRVQKQHEEQYDSAQFENVVGCYFASLWLLLCSTMTCFQQQFVTVNSMYCCLIAHVSILFWCSLCNFFHSFSSE